MKTANIGLSKITVQVKLPPNTFWWDCHLARGAYSGQEGKKNRLGAPSPVLPQYPCRLHYTIIKLHCHAVQQFIPNILQTCSTVPGPAPMTLHYAHPKATEREPHALTERCYLVQELCAGGITGREREFICILPLWCSWFCFQSVNSLFLTQSWIHGGVIMLAKRTHMSAT